MSSTQHPIRNAEHRVFKQVDAEEYLGRLHPYDTYPILFFGKSEEQVRERMAAFVADVVSKNEETFLARAAAAVARKAKRKGGVK